MADDRCQSLQGAPSCRGRKRGQSRHEPYQRGLNTQIPLAVDAQGLPLRVIITEGTRADCTQAGQLIEGVSADYLLADRGYDTNAILKQAQNQHMKRVIPPKRNRTEQRPYDENLYKARHLVENAFLHLKRWRGIATRYAKNTASFLAAIPIRCIAIWANIL
jgi:transposase